MSSLDFWKQVKETRKLLKKNKVENYQTLTISDDIFNMLYKDAERKEKLEKVWEIIKEKPSHCGNLMRWLKILNYQITYKNYLQIEKKSIPENCIQFGILTEIEFNLLKEMLK